MRPIPAALQARLDSGVTTLAHVWIVRRTDGVTLGFTDHDCDLAVDGIIARAATGFRGTDIAERLGFAVSGGEVAGALSAEGITEADIAAGRYDGASVTISLVDWSEPGLSMPLRSGVIGEITREDGAFKAELRSLSHRLDETRGRLYTPQCGADLGDARCGLSLAATGRSFEGAVASRPADDLIVTALAATAGWLTQGRLTWLTGANSGLSVEVRSHAGSGPATTLGLWHAPPQPIAVGDTFRVTLGCDKQFATCRDRFGNAASFRGFPHMPGNDFVLSYPMPGGTSA